MVHKCFLGGERVLMVEEFRHIATAPRYRSFIMEYFQAGVTKHLSKAS